MNCVKDQKLSKSEMKYSDLPSQIFNHTCFDLKHLNFLSGLRAMCSSSGMLPLLLLIVFGGTFFIKQMFSSVRVSI